MQQKYILIKKPVLDSLCKKRYPLGRQSTRALCEATFGTREVLDMAILVSGGAGYFRIAYYYVKQEEWSQEIVLDIFLKLWKQRDTLLDVKNIEDYCFILVKNASLNYLEKESKYATIHSDSLPEPQEQSYSPEESLISEELFAIYVKALDRLPERCREIFIRIREEKQSYAQVAEELDISIKTVDAQLQKAVTRLKEMISSSE